MKGCSITNQRAKGYGNSTLYKYKYKYKYKYAFPEELVN